MSDIKPQKVEELDIVKFQLLEAKIHIARLGVQNMEQELANMKQDIQQKYELSDKDEIDLNTFEIKRVDNKE